MPTDFTERIIQIIKSIPKGKVLTYGFIAKLAGNPRAARQVSWILHSSSKKYNLPWHRVISSKGIISLKSIDDCEYQKNLLEQEGIKVEDGFKIDLRQYLWKGKLF
ncbi:MAG: MGMT family protein [Promethearchaeota archaeon]|nr:MAG: MGMT family protein [Candidatus Lokiarchaeota archaeon]